jgi:hypothetical protein
MQRSRLSQRRERRSDDRQRIELQIEPGPWLLPTRTCFCALASACGPRRKVSRELDGSASYSAPVVQPPPPYIYTALHPRPPRPPHKERTPRNRIRPLPALFLPPQTTRMVRCSSHTCRVREEGGDVV